MRQKTLFKIFLLIAVCLPGALQAQSFVGEIHSLQSVLDQLYADMLPLCNKLIGVGRGLAAFAALWYISSRVWRQLANAEPIDFYPLLRPFALGFCILIFPYVIALINGILKPTVTGTAGMVRGSNNAIAYLLKMKEDAIKRHLHGKCTLDLMAAVTAINGIDTLTRAEQRKARSMEWETTLSLPWQRLLTISRIQSNNGCLKSFIFYMNRQHCALTR